MKGTFYIVRVACEMGTYEYECKDHPSARVLWALLRGHEAVQRVTMHDSAHRFDKPIYSWSNDE